MEDFKDLGNLDELLVHIDFPGFQVRWENRTVKGVQSSVKNLQVEHRFAKELSSIKAVRCAEHERL